MKKLLCIINALLIVIMNLIPCSAVTTSARAAVLIDAKSGAVLYEKNAEAKRGMASTTKIMTALVALDKCDLRESVKVPAEALNVIGTAMGLRADDELPVKSLLYGLLLASGNDAANALAYHIAGGVSEFAKMMNEKANELGLENTHFMNPSGLTEKGHYSSAYDMAVMAAYAMNNPIFKLIVSSYNASVDFINPEKTINLTNHNKMLVSYDGAVGVKTGYTDASGRCLVTAAERKGCMLIAVTLSDTEDWKDHKAMLDYGFSSLKKVKINDSFSIPAVGGVKDVLKAKPVSGYDFFVPEIIYDKLEKRVYSEHFVYAPGSKNDIIGSIEFYYEGELLYSVDLVLSEDNRIKKTEES